MGGRKVDIARPFTLVVNAAVRQLVVYLRIFPAAAFTLARG